MKILIYGEYSGYGKSLATGFRALGYEASVFSPNGDGWKNITSDFSLQSLTKIGKIIDLICLIPRFLKFDIIMVTNPDFFKFKLLGPMILFLFNVFHKRIYLLCCGDDVEYIRAGESGLIKNFIYKGVSYPRENYFKTMEDKFVNYICASSALKIIPTMYDYELPWKMSQFNNKVTSVIPLACDAKHVDDIKSTEMKSIKIMHGINRRDVKGSNVILAALNRIKNEFSNVVVYTPEKLSQSEYLELLHKIDISIDQCKSHSYGMNAIYSMFNGHVVLAPADEFHCSSFNITSSPIVSICNNEEQVYLKLKEILTEANSLDDRKRITLDYAKKHHDAIVVCQKIINVL